MQLVDFMFFAMLGEAVIVLIVAAVAMFKSWAGPPWIKAFQVLISCTVVVSVLIEHTNRSYDALTNKYAYILGLALYMIYVNCYFQL